MDRVFVVTVRSNVLKVFANRETAIGWAKQLGKDTVRVDAEGRVRLIPARVVEIRVE